MPLFNDSSNLIYPHPGFVSGKYYPSSAIFNTTNNTCVIGYVYYTFFHIPITQQFSKIAFICNTGVSGGEQVRLGIYKVQAGLPSSLVVDAGTISFTTTGTKEIDISTTLTAGWYAIATAVTPSNINLVSLSTNFCNLFGSSSVSITNFNGLRANLTFGPLPANASLNSLVEVGVPIIWLKTA